MIILAADITWVLGAQATTEMRSIAGLFLY